MTLSILPYLFMGLWVGTMVSMPILRWTVGDDLLPWTVTAGVLLQSITVLLLLGREWSRRQIARMTLLVLPLAWGIEFIGSSTGIPFGPYHYTKELPFQIGHVPLLIPCAWLMMLPPAWGVAQRMVGDHRSAAFLITSALAFTAWDLFLDPQMVAWGYWSWAVDGGYFGIPWVNYAGWIGAAALLTLLVHPPAIQDQRQLWIYTITWLLQTIGQGLFWQMPGPAAVGFVGMGSFVLLAWQKERESRRLNDRKLRE